MPTLSAWDVVPESLPADVKSKAETHISAIRDEVEICKGIEARHTELTAQYAKIQTETAAFRDANIPKTNDVSNPNTQATLNELLVARSVEGYSLALQQELLEKENSLEEVNTELSEIPSRRRTATASLENSWKNYRSFYETHGVDVGTVFDRLPT